jgi:hypothetical protein
MVQWIDLIGSPGRAVSELFRALGVQTIKIGLDELVHVRRSQPVGLPSQELILEEVR